MTDQNEDRPLGRFPGFNPALFARRAGRTWSLRVTEAFDVTPRMRRVRFSGADLGDMDWRPGQDLVLMLPSNSGEARRHYTIREHSGGALDIDFVMHGASPATNWARAARPGAVITAQGPRGRTHVHADAASHWFVGDETSLPAIVAMAESLPADANATLLIEVKDESEHQVLAARANCTVHWIDRNGAHTGPSSLVLDRLKTLAPSAAGAHAYLLGETSNVRAQRHYLVERGFTRDQITAEGYWRPGRVGGHDHV